MAPASAYLPDRLLSTRASSQVVPTTFRPKVTEVPQLAATQIDPVPQTVPSATTVFEGHPAVDPEQVSGTSQTLVAERHTTELARNPLAGQAAALPGHVSAMSQGPASARHTVLALAKVSAGHKGDPPE